MHKIRFSKNALDAKKLAIDVKAGKLKRIRRGIYSSELGLSDAEIIKKNWMSIVSYIAPGAILSYRTAIDLRPTPYLNDTSIVFMTSTYNKSIKLPGLVIKIMNGDNQNSTEIIHPDLMRTSEARTFLENLTPVRNLRGIKTLPKEKIEMLLAKILHNRGEHALNVMRDSAKEMANKLNLNKEFKILNDMISSLLSTNSDDQVLTTDYAKALIRKEPYDEHRMNLFADLAAYLKKCDFVNREYIYDKTSFKNLAFFESYFSNYIEGTRFIIDEAEDIVFSGATINNRHADSHDVLANFLISNDYFEISKTPSSAKELIELLQTRHSLLMQQRPEVSPGNFKNTNNRAGNTFFVKSGDVIGTLTRAFEIYSLLPEGMHRALFMHFLIAEVHPFNDGNGRISRIMLNSELVKNQKFKIIIPNVFRDSYMSAMRAVTRDAYFHSYSRMMDMAQAYTASITWKNYPEARGKLEVDRAEYNEDEGLPIFNRAIQKLILSRLPI